MQRKSPPRVGSDLTVLVAALVLREIASRFSKRKIELRVFASSVDSSPRLISLRQRDAVDAFDLALPKLIKLEHAPRVADRAG